MGSGEGCQDFWLRAPGVGLENEEALGSCPRAAGGAVEEGLVLVTGYMAVGVGGEVIDVLGPSGLALLQNL